MRATPNMWASFNRAIARVSNVSGAVFFIFGNAVTRHTRNKTMYIFRSLSKMNS